MSDRLCGYCRKPGHVKGKCDVRLLQIETLRKHIGSQRKLAQQILLANGIGVGAIVAGYDYWTGEEHPCIVPSLQINQEYIDWRNVKYKKQVRSTVSVYGIDIPENKLDGLIRYIPKNKITVPVYKMSDMSCTMTAYFSLDRLPVQIVRPAKTGWDYHRHSEVISPSSDTDVTDEYLLEQFALNERLTLTPGTLSTPIL